MAFRRKTGTTMEKWEFLFDFGYFSLQNDEKCLTAFCKLISVQPIDSVVGEVTVLLTKTNMPLASQQEKPRSFLAEKQADALICTMDNSSPASY